MQNREKRPSSSSCLSAWNNSSPTGRIFMKFDIWVLFENLSRKYRGADKSLAQPTSQCILFDGENISFDANPVICINSTNIPPSMIINRIYETQNILSL